MYVFFFPLLSSLQSKAAKPSEEGFLRPFGSKRQSRAQPPPAPSLSREGSNRSSCRSYSKERSDHQRSGVVV